MAAVETISSVAFFSLHELLPIAVSFYHHSQIQLFFLIFVFVLMLFRFWVKTMADVVVVYKKRKILLKALIPLSK